jgi:hypothetical protein
VLRGFTAITCTVGSFSLTRENKQKPSPTGVEDRTIQPSLLRNLPSWVVGDTTRRPRHVIDRQLFVADHVVVLDESVRSLVGVIKSLTTNLAVYCWTKLTRVVRTIHIDAEARKNYYMR